jgi:hypothetical protein
MFSEFNVLPRSTCTSLNDDLDNKLAFIKYEFYEQYGNWRIHFKYHRRLCDGNDPLDYLISIPKNKKDSVNYYCYYTIEIKKNNRVPSYLMDWEMSEMIKFLLKCCNVNYTNTFHLQESSRVVIPISYLQEHLPTPDEIKNYKQHKLMELNKDLDLSEIINNYVW